MPHEVIAISESKFERMKDDDRFIVASSLIRLAVQLAGRDNFARALLLSTLQDAFSDASTNNTKETER